jgi:DNA polymerase III subunit epsilon
VTVHTLADPRSIDPSTPLSHVTFCVVDLETTGGSPAECAITEIGAVRYRGGERLGTFHTLVDPGQAIPRFITHLTGLDDGALAGAPSIGAVIPSLAEFLAGAVFVAHNARFDFSFVNAALATGGYDPLPPPPVCTVKLAKRIVWPDVPNVRLDTLAQYFRSAVRPVHRALPDAEACADVLHGLLDLGGRLGILTLGDLLEAGRARGRPHHSKIRLADALPHAPGVYLFRGREGRVLYVGKSKDLRARVKSYFYGDDRKKVGDLLAETQAVEGRECGSELEALVAEARLIAEHEPKYNRRGRTWRRSAYLRVDTSEAWPRIKTVKEPRGTGTFLGPFPSTASARLAKEALEDVFSVRRCSRSMGRSTRFSACVLADLGRCAAPCDGRVTPERYEELVLELTRSLSHPGGLLEALEARMWRLADRERFEEAALARERLRALAEALQRSRRDAWLLAGPFAVAGEGGRRIAVEPPGPTERRRAHEAAAIRSWVAANRPGLVDAAVPVAEPVDGGAALARLLACLRPTTRDG